MGATYLSMHRTTDRETVVRELHNIVAANVDAGLPWFKIATGRSRKGKECEKLAAKLEALAEVCDAESRVPDEPWNVRETHVCHSDGHVFRIGRSLEDAEEA